MDGTPLPAALSGNVSQRLIEIDETLLYLINGALAYLLDTEPLEQTGTLTVENARNALSDAFYTYLDEDFTVSPVGATMMWHMATPPPKWLICDGSFVLKTTYPKLYALWGNKYGSTATTFKIVDMRDRSPWGATPTFLGLDSVYGVTLVTIGINEMPVHHHFVPRQTGTASAIQSVAAVGRLPTVGGTEIITTDTGNGQPHQNVHPIIGVHYIVYAGN